MTVLERWIVGFTALIACIALVWTALTNTGLRGNLIEACEQSPIITILADDLRTQIKNARGPGATVTHADFPDIPLGRFRQLVQQGIERDRAQLAQIENLDCASRY